MHHFNLGSLSIFFMVIYHCVLYDLADVSREAVKSKLDAHPYFYLSLDSRFMHLGKIELFLN